MMAGKYVEATVVFSEGGAGSGKMCVVQRQATYGISAKVGM